MLEFLRRYQKFFFFVITFFVVSSFVFFGTYSAFSTGQKIEDRILGKAVDGSELKLSEISALSRFLASDCNDATTAGRNALLNLLNDGFVRKDILSTGVGEILVRKNFELFQKELEQKIHRVQCFRSYEHPDAPFLSAKAVWQKFAPDIIREWGMLQSASKITPDSFVHLVHLYQLQSRLPAEWLRKILLMNEQQHRQWLRPDPRLQQDDLDLFGFHSAIDWFGKDFFDLVAEFVHNAALLAQEKGYQVSIAEAKAELKYNFEESVRKLREANIPVEITWKDQLRILGLDDQDAAAIWKKVVLVRRYFSDIGHSVFLDRLPYTEFSTVATEKAEVDVYQWPESLRFQSASDLFAFEHYCKSIFHGEKDLLTLPKTPKSVEEVQKQTPELVGISYRAKVIAVDKREVALKAPLKEVWDFETQDLGWKKLKKEFAFLQSISATDAQERFQVLEKLAPAERSKVDFYARKLLLTSHPEWVKDSLDTAKGEEKEFVLSNGKIALPYIDDPAKLATLFQQIPASPETALLELSCFETKDAFFRFENIEKISDPKIKLYADAIQDGSLQHLVDAALEKEWSKYKSKLETDKSFIDAKEEVAELSLKEMKKAILAFSSPKEEAVDEKIHFASRRLAAVASQAKSELEYSGESIWLKQETDDPLLAQFKLEHIEKEINRNAEEDWMSQIPFALLPQTWSPIHVANDGKVLFIYLRTRQTMNEPILEQITFGKEILVADAERTLAEKLLTTMQKKQAIIIPLQPKSETE